MSRCGCHNCLGVYSVVEQQTRRDNCVSQDGSLHIDIMVHVHLHVTPSEIPKLLSSRTAVQGVHTAKVGFFRQMRTSGKKEQ